MQYRTVVEDFSYHFWDRDFQFLYLIIACCYNTVDVNTINWSKHETGILTSSPIHHLQIRRNGLFLDLDLWLPCDVLFLITLLSFLVRRDFWPRVEQMIWRRVTGSAYYLHHKQQGTYRPHSMQAQPRLHWQTQHLNSQNNRASFSIV